MADDQQQPAGGGCAKQRVDCGLPALCRSAWLVYKLGLVVDLGGCAAVAKPLGVPLTGLLAISVVTRAHHLQALTGVPNSIRVAVAWALAYALPPRRANSPPFLKPTLS